MTNTPDKSELLPCPFCGGETVRQFHPFEQRGYVIDCNRCNGGFHNIPKDQAVKRWNTRASSRPADQVPDMVERVARAIAASFEKGSPDIAADLRMDWQTWEPEARAAIAALQAVPVTSEVGIERAVKAFKRAAWPVDCDGAVAFAAIPAVGEWEGPPYEYGVTWGLETEPTTAMIEAAASVAHERGCYGVTRSDLSAIIRAALKASGEE